MLDLVLPHIPFTESFVEVFAGGMSVGLAVAARGTRVWAYDIDRSLACSLKAAPLLLSVPAALFVKL